MRSIQERNEIFADFMNTDVKLVSQMKYEANNQVLTIEQDELGESPREWDNMSKMIFIGKHSGYGDAHDLHQDHNSFEDHQAFVAKQLDAAWITPVYAYIHSGMTISTEPFSCPWDSGKLGWVVLTREKIRSEYGVKRITQKTLDKAIKVAVTEIETLDQYISGDVYGFTIEDENGDHIDSCGGFYGSDPKTNGMADHLPEHFQNLIQ